MDGTVSHSGEVAVVAEALAIEGATTARAGAVHTTSSSRISAGTLTVAAAELDNAGVLITHAGTLNADITGTTRHSATLSAQTHATLTLGGDLINSGALLSQGPLTLTGRADAADTTTAGADTAQAAISHLDTPHPNTPLGRLSNAASGQLNGGAGLTVHASALDNTGRLGSSAGPMGHIIS